MIHTRLATRVAAYRSGLRSRPAATTVCAVLLVCGSLAACATPGGDHVGRWTAPAGVTSAQQQTDERTCKRQADDYAGRRVMSPDRLQSRNSRFGTSPMAQADWARGDDAFRQYYTDCMLTLGYTAAQ